MVMDCIITQEEKGLTKKLYFVIRSRRNISLRFIVHIILHGYVLQYNTRSKRVKEEIVLLSRRKTSFYAKFQVNCLPVSTWL